MTGILIRNDGGHWTAKANRHWTVTAPTAHAVVEMLRRLSLTEPLDFQ